VFVCYLFLLHIVRLLSSYDRCCCCCHHHILNCDILFCVLVSLFCLSSFPLVPVIPAAFKTINVLPAVGNKLKLKIKSSDTKYTALHLLLPMLLPPYFLPPYSLTPYSFICFPRLLFCFTPPSYSSSSPPPPSPSSSSSLPLLLLSPPSSLPLLLPPFLPSVLPYSLS